MVSRSSSFTKYVFLVFLEFLYFFKILFAVTVLFLFSDVFLISFIVSIFCFFLCFLWISENSLTSLSLSRAVKSSSFSSWYVLSSINEEVLFSGARLIKLSSFSCWYVLSSINEEVLFSGARLIKLSSFSCWYVLSSIKEVLFFCFLAAASLCVFYFSLIFLAANCAFVPGTKVAISSKNLMVLFDSWFFGISFL